MKNLENSILVRFGEPGIGGILSNLKKRSFMFAGINCNSIEGVLQGIKFKDVDKQKKIAIRHGMDAKRSGQGKRLDRQGMLAHWNGQSYRRDSKAYNQFVRSIYWAACWADVDMQVALIESGDRPFIHPIGSKDIEKSVLTENEFVTILTDLRKMVINIREKNANVASELAIYMRFEENKVES